MKPYRASPESSMWTGNGVWVTTVAAKGLDCSVEDKRKIRTFPWKGAYPFVERLRFL
ncbi:hypothetical protein [Porphyromonas miyakawae]|uniref:hypothetical protein n=1 Tax=Porphyromonas miyakawae TaxID=3137470 RepID=UPI00398C5AD7